MNKQVKIVTNDLEELGKALELRQRAEHHASVKAAVERKRYKPDPKRVAVHSETSN